MPCDDHNAQAIDQSSFWDEDGINWDAHRIGWAIAGGCTALTVIITVIGVLRQAKNYTVPGEQRQVLRILYMPAVYAIISFFSYRFFRYYTYYSLISIAYEAITLSAFMLLLIEYVAATASGHDADNALARKDKRKLPMPFCCWRYRPTKAYFMYTVKWSVLQYVIIRPLGSIVGIICEKFNVLCHSEGYNWRYASVYIEVIVFISITIALYGLLIFYGLTAEELRGRRPLAKFLCIKLIVMVPFYQSFVFSWLESSGRIKATKYWSSTNIVNGLNALAICVEMVFFSALMLWAYSSAEYTGGAKIREKQGGVWKALWDSVNLSDFGYEIWVSMRYFVDRARGRAGVYHERTGRDFGETFGVEGSRGKGEGGGERVVGRDGNSWDEDIRLAPYGGGR